MEKDSIQPIIGRFTVWVADINLSKRYWRLLLLEHGIYDPKNETIEQLLNYHEGPTLHTSIPNIFGGTHRGDVILDFFLWLYNEDKQTCLDLMKWIYEEFKDDEDTPDSYPYVDYLEEYEVGGQFPDFDFDDMVPAFPDVIGDDAEFEFYRTLVPHFKDVSEDVFIVDSYIDEEIIELYLSETSEDTEKRILTKNTQGNFDAVAGKFTKSNKHRIEVRQHPDCHDRLLFVDNRCFAAGTSIKDAGRKPTYLIEFDAVEAFRDPWEQMWDKADTYKVFE